MQATKELLLDPLPRELVVLVLGYLDAKSLCKFSLTCSKAQALVQANAMLWERACHQELCLFELKKRGSLTWKDCYVESCKARSRRKKLIQERLDKYKHHLKAALERSTAGNEAQCISNQLICEGKTTLLAKLNPTVNPWDLVMPIGTFTQHITWKEFDITFAHLPPQRARILLRSMVAQTAALIWLVDSTDKESLAESAAELESILFDETISTPVLFIFWAKQDLPNALSVEELKEGMGLRALLPPELIFEHQACCIPSGDGIIEMYFWLKKIFKEWLAKVDIK